MAKFVLDNDFDYDLLLVGISSHARDYRLCWSLNQNLKLQLAKAEKGLQVPATKNAEANSFNLFEFEDEETRVVYTLLSNKNNAGYLLPEVKHADYLLMLRNNFGISINKLIDQIKNCDQVQTAFEIQAEELKSRDNLIYF